MLLFSRSDDGGWTKDWTEKLEVFALSENSAFAIMNSKDESTVAAVGRTGRRADHDMQKMWQNIYG